MAKAKKEEKETKEEQVEYLPKDERQPFLTWVSKQVTDHPVVKSCHGL